ncbi:ferredoxin reductase family protein [Clostridium folliculivorans]|uniref:Membrane protein n=1 Tax=Clostridium folliculivorans TaxID=2886038 RepID=A0A9W5Y361_9CLOT|nr:ferric reductase-like transmembrane domain-containing protein [Clostridium folliculivorans]GKU25896.1 membrane protein [Clostridium folliculivorans]GKU27982.1 membrane protein [Clostridium folliculivorans]
MKKKLGFLFIILSMLITFVTWLFVSSTREISIASEYSQLIAAFALVAFALVNFISTRNKILDYIFNGLDKSYVYHKYLSISALLLVVIHNITIEIGKRAEIKAGIPIPRDPYAMYGSFSLYLFVILIITAIVAKKLNYERWKVIHKFMIVAYMMGVYHYYGSSTYPVLSLDPFSIWLNIVNFIGVISILYSVLFYEKTAFKFRFKVSKLKVVSDGTLEITGKALGRNIEFKPGQFAFIKLIGKDSKFASHPFTISAAPTEREIQFTIKSLGDDTKVLLETLKLGDKFAVEGPHGNFDYKEGSKNQIWIAGGIGVTPFRSFLQAKVREDYSIDFFYAYNSEQDGAYLEELEKLTLDSNVRLHLFNFKDKGFLSVEQMKNYTELNQVEDVYFCGPKGMRESLKTQFKKSNFNNINMHYEQFQFK